MLFTTLAPVFIILAAGFFIRRVGILSAEADASLLKMFINLLYPAFVVSTLVGNDALNQSANVWLPPIVAGGTIVLSFFICYLGARLLRLPKGIETRTFLFVTALYNYSYMALPVIDGLFGRKTLAVLLTHNLGVEIAFWSGASLILASQANRGERSVWRGFVNMPVIAILLSLVLNGVTGGAHLPGWIAGAFSMVGASAIPIALLITGATLSDFLSDLRPSPAGAVAVVGACVLRLGALPFVFLALARWLPCTIELKRVLVVQSAMPCAMLPIVLAKHYGGDTGMAVRIVFATTGLAVITIPYWIHFGMRFAHL